MGEYSRLPMETSSEQVFPAERKASLSHLAHEPHQSVPDSSTLHEGDVIERAAAFAATGAGVAEAL